MAIKWFGQPHFILFDYEYNNSNSNNKMLINKLLGNSL